MILPLIELSDRLIRARRGYYTDAEERLFEAHTLKKKKSHPATIAEARVRPSRSRRSFACPPKLRLAPVIVCARIVLLSTRLFVRLYRLSLAPRRRTVLSPLFLFACILIYFLWGSYVCAPHRFSFLSIAKQLLDPLAIFAF